MGKIDLAQLAVISREIPATFTQAHRLVNYLNEVPYASTVEANQACSVGNLSDVARRVNPILHKHGYFIGCERPPVPIPNRFGEASQMFLWKLYTLPTVAANDDSYTEQDPQPP